MESSKSLISIDPHNRNLHDWGTEERKREDLQVKIAIVRIQVHKNCLMQLQE